MKPSANPINRSWLFGFVLASQSLVEKKEDVVFLKSLCEPKKLMSFCFLLTCASGA
jgi:hypothetical protein